MTLKENFLARCIQIFKVYVLRSPMKFSFVLISLLYEVFPFSSTDSEDTAGDSEDKCEETKPHPETIPVRSKETAQEPGLHPRILRLILTYFLFCHQFRFMTSVSLK